MNSVGPRRFRFVNRFREYLLNLNKLDRQLLLEKNPRDTDLKLVIDTLQLDLARNIASGERARRKIVETPQGLGATNELPAVRQGEVRRAVRRRKAFCKLKRRRLSKEFVKTGAFAEHELDIFYGDVIGKLL